MEEGHALRAECLWLRLEGVEKSALEALGKLFEEGCVGGEQEGVDVIADRGAELAVVIVIALVVELLVVGEDPILPAQDGDPLCAAHVFAQVEGLLGLASPAHGPGVVRQPREHVGGRRDAGGGESGVIWVASGSAHDVRDGIFSAGEGDFFRADDLAFVAEFGEGGGDLGDVGVDGGGEESAKFEVALGAVEGEGVKEEGLEFGVARGGGGGLGGRGGHRAKVGGWRCLGFDHNFGSPIFGPVRVEHYVKHISDRHMVAAAS